MEEEPSQDLPSFVIAYFSSGSQYPSLDPQKKWNILSREIFSSHSGRLVDLAKSLSKLFPDEIRNVAAREIQPTASESVQKHQTPTNRQTLACEQALGLGVWIFVGGGGGRGGKRTKIQTPSPRACSQARQTCTWFPHLVSVLGSCGREMFRPMAF